MAGFVVVGAIGVVVLVVALLLGDWNLDVPGLGDGGGLLSTTAIGAFLAAVGLGGAVAAAAGAPTVVAGASAVGAGAAVGWVAWRLSAAAARMPTDPPVRAADLVGREGRVVTAIGSGRLGEVLVRHAGQQAKLSASADGPIRTGTRVVVVEVRSPTAVHVVDATEFWTPSNPPREEQP